MIKQTLSIWRIIWLMITRGPAELWRDLMAAKWKLGVILLVSGVALILWGISSALLWGIFLLFLLYDYDSRVLAAVAIVALVICPILLELGKFGIDFDFTAAAERVAVYAFFFLVMTVVIQIVDIKRHPDSYLDHAN